MRLLPPDSLRLLRLLPGDCLYDYFQKAVRGTALRTLFLHRLRTTTSTKVITQLVLTNPDHNNSSGVSDTRLGFEYSLKRLCFILFMLNSGLIMNTSTCFVSLTIIILLKYMSNCEIKMY